MDITLSQYWHDVALMANGHMGQRQRYGQIAFNLLADIRPDLSERIRGTTADPFHATGVEDERFIRFCWFLNQNWEKK